MAMTTPRDDDAAKLVESEGPRVGRRPADTFANRLILVRALAGHLSIREAADLCGVGRGAWTNWERGARPYDRLEVCRAVADALDIDHDWLLFGGALAGARGMPTKRAVEDNRRYPAVHVRPRDTRPSGRATPGPRPGQTPRPEQRRPVRVTGLQVA